MSTPRINNSEFRFCEILWENEPVSSTDIVKLCKEKLEWSKSTTYTIIKRLSDRGVVKFVDKTVSSLVSREDACKAESMAVVDRNFAGSLPGFVATFVGGRQLSEEELDELQAIIDGCRKDNDRRDPFKMLSKCNIRKHFHSPGCSDTADSRKVGIKEIYMCSLDHCSPSPCNTGFV